MSKILWTLVFLICWPLGFVLIFLKFCIWYLGLPLRAVNKLKKVVFERRNQI
jgi:hypothetical protein